MFKGIARLSQLVAGTSSPETITGLLQFAQPKVEELTQQFNRPKEEGGILEEGEAKCMIAIDSSPDGELKIVLQTLAVNDEQQVIIKRFINFTDLITE